MKEEREIKVVLYDGSEVIMNTEERVIFHAPRQGAIPLSVDADTVFDDVLITLEQANQQLTEKDATINALREALNDAKDSIQVIDAHGERPWEVTKYCGLAIELIEEALGEGDKE
ncbi:hypothetical protein QYF50_18825 [Paenibacillus vini]|uniref:hypothetical protein n=1 Tax=Paenibacillus vini TaxID=1476024 RepID=UPI0025B6F9D7|nr:hypothetical protein [Paenibacillus vini]MDN4069960.1 hypothetical protein [Paenibacillus vini]